MRLNLIRISAFLFLLLLTTPVSSVAQSPLWMGAAGGSSGNERLAVSEIAPNGNIYFAGYFSGTHDFDPSAGVYNLTSNGAEDMFLAVYTPAGSLVWAISGGGSGHNDKIESIKIDNSNNVYVTGYYRGTSVDFDPSPTGTAYLSNNGGAQTTVFPWGGDAFVAKYSSTGAYLWCHSLGGSTIYDVGQSVCLDDAGNLYIAGDFHGTMDVDPSPAVYNLNSINGVGYVIKYTPAGQLIWAKNIGNTGGDCGVWDMEYANGSLYLHGIFEGTGDFNPSPTATAMLTTSGTYDAYLAKYDTALNYQFAVKMGGNNIDEGIALEIDASGNAYVTGYSIGSAATFGTISLPYVGAGENIYLAKYNNQGQCQWAHLLGSNFADRGWRLDLRNNNLFVIGFFSDVIDFDPSPNTANLVSNGSKDIFVARYDTDGNYLCAFGIGGSGPDEGNAIAVDGIGDMYIGGFFSGSNVDFDPSPAQLLFSSNGGTDNFWGKYSWQTSAGVLPNGYLTGDTICNGQQAQLIFTATAGTGPFSITYANGANTYTQTGIVSGVPFNLTPNPSGNVTYTLQSVSSGSGCFSLYNSSVNSSALILANANPVANAGNDTSACTNSPIQLNGSGAGTFVWSPANAVTNTSIANPNTVFQDTAITFVLTVTSSAGCADTDTVQVTLRPKPTAFAGIDTGSCQNVPLQLQATGGGAYQWAPATGLNNPNSANPVFNASASSTFQVVVVNQHGCTDTDEVAVTVHPLPVAVAGNDTLKCPADSIILNGSGGNTYVWYPAIAMSNPSAANPVVYPSTTTSYSMIVISPLGCRDTDMVTVAIIPPPNFSVTPNAATICAGDTVSPVAAGGASYSWYPAVDISATNIANPVIYPTGDITYYVIANSAQCGWIDTLPVVVTIAPVPETEVTKSNDIDCAHSNAELSASGGVTFTWTPAQYLNNDKIAHPVATPSATTWFYVEIENAFGCAATDSILLLVDQPGEEVLAFPNAFTPNHDGINDCFRPVATEQILEYDISIFNRWGNRVFHTTNPNECWNGEYNGREQLIGTYYYYYKARTLCGSFSGKGDMHIIK